MISSFHLHPTPAVFLVICWLFHVEGLLPRLVKTKEAGCPSTKPQLDTSLDVNDALTSSHSASRRYYLSDTARTVAVAYLFPALTAVSINDKNAWAVGEGTERMVFRKTPSAPTSALLPAVQQRLLLEAVRELAAGVDNSRDKKSPGDSVSKRQLIDSILLPLAENNGFLDNNNQDYKVVKQNSPSKVLSGAVVRASMNIYTANLNYGPIRQEEAKGNPSEVYEITDPSWKKAYIRANDGLPSVDKVITADLDLRDLYRNQVQQKMDDASAEWYSPNCDLQEFRALLKDAAVAFDSWLDRISGNDVTAAIQAVLEGKELQLYEPYSAGFIPTTQ